MSGGGSDKKKKNKSEEPTNIPMQTVQPFMPGLDSMIAQQLGMGGFGDPSSLLAYMNSIHTPMQVPNITAQPIPAPSSGGGGNGGDDDERGGVRLRQQPMNGRHPLDPRAYVRR